LMGKDDYRDLRQAGDSEDHIHRRSWTFCTLPSKIEWLKKYWM
jgi:hypothetical protein